MDTRERTLTGGRVTPGVVRIGGTVRRPVSGHSNFAHSLLEYLKIAGFDGAPTYLGVDEQGREILSYLPGEVPDDLREFSDWQASAGAKLLRSFHDVTVASELRGEHEVICHGDASPCNFVFRDEIPYALIDFDTAHPGKRREDMGYSAWLWFDLGYKRYDPRHQGRRLARFVRSYGGFDIGDALRSVLDAQSVVARDRTVPLATQAWATTSREWTLRKSADFERGIGDIA